MNTQLLDATVDGSLVPYRDAQGRPRLLDLSPPRAAAARRSPEHDSLRRSLTKLLRTACSAAASVHDEETYRAWYLAHAEPFLLAGAEATQQLGGCIGDEGRDWFDLGDRLLAATHRPGWRVE